MVDFINKPILMHQLEALVAVGCTEIVLAMSYMPDTLMNDLSKWLGTVTKKISNLFLDWQPQNPLRR